MNKSPAANDRTSGLHTVLKVLVWPFAFVWRILYDHWLSYVFGKVLRDENRVYSVRFVWYGDSVYLHPMIWGSVVLFFVAKSGLLGEGWPLLTWFVLLGICFLTVIYNFDILRAGVLLVSLAAIFGLAYISTAEWAWNPVSWIYDHVIGWKVTVSEGFYIASAWVFAILISAELFSSWLFHRVELDESYVYEHRFLQGTSREPVFARGLKRETKDLLELLILGAADIQHRTRSGFKRFKNVPGASLGLGRAIDNMMDYRSRGEAKVDRKHRDLDDQVMPSDAYPDMEDDGISDDDAGPG